MTTIPDDYAIKFNNILTFLTRLTGDRITPIVEKQLLEMLPNAIPFFSHLVLRDNFPTIERLTINKKVLGSNSRIKEIKFLKNPPADKVKAYGRCNMKMQSVLYGSFNMLTVLSELKPRIGDLISMTTWKAKEGSKLTYCPIFKNQPKREKVMNLNLRDIEIAYNKKLLEHSPTVGQVIDNLVTFVCNSFTKYVKPDCDSDYLISAYFSNKILYEFENGTIDAIYYPSVQQDLSFENIAIKPATFDRDYFLAEVKELVVLNDPTTGSRGTAMQGIGQCDKFDLASDKILWDKGREMIPTDLLNKYVRQFDLRLD